MLLLHALGCPPTGGDLSADQRFARARGGPKLEPGYGDQGRRPALRATR